MTIAHARHLIAVKRFDEAREQLSGPLADPQAGAEPWCLLAQAERGAGRLQESAAAAQRALAIEPGNEWGLRLLALAQLDLGQARDAEATARRGLVLEPDQAEMVHTLVSILLARRQFREAERLAARNLAVNPGRSLAWETAARVSLRRSRWKECEVRARRALAIAPQDPDLMMVLGVALQARGRRTEAAQLYAAVGRVDPRDNRGRMALGELGLRVSNSRIRPVLRYALWLLPQVWLGLVLGLIAQSIMQWHARSKLEPGLRAVVRKEQRAAAGTRLFGFGAGCLVLAIIWTIVGAFWFAAAVAGVAAVLFGLWWWWAPRQRRAWLAAVRDRLRR